jgi:hypothetical protein
MDEGGAGHVADQMMDLASGRIDASVLLREIDADLIALELVAVFVANTFEVSAETALQMSLTAYEAQTFLYATKHTCLLLKRYAGRHESHDDFMRDDWLAGLQFSMRARCMLRRAGILLSRWCAPGEDQTAATINRFVPVVDAMFLGSSDYRADLAVAAHREAENLLAAAPRWNADRGRALMEAARKSVEIKLDLLYMMVAMGFPGGTDPIRWFEHLLEAQQVGS